MLDDPHNSRPNPLRSVCHNLHCRFYGSTGGKPEPASSSAMDRISTMDNIKAGRHRRYRLLLLFLRVNTLVARTMVVYSSDSGNPTLKSAFLDRSVLRKMAARFGPLFFSKLLVCSCHRDSSARKLWFLCSVT